jgi:hypothetical protein
MQNQASKLLLLDLIKTDASIHGAAGVQYD